MKSKQPRQAMGRLIKLQQKYPKSPRFGLRLLLRAIKRNKRQRMNKNVREQEASETERENEKTDEEYEIRFCRNCLNCLKKTVSRYFLLQFFSPKLVPMIPWDHHIVVVSIFPRFCNFVL